MYLSDAEVAKLAADALSWARPRPPLPMGFLKKNTDELFSFPSSKSPLLFATSSRTCPRSPFVWLHVFPAVTRVSEEVPHAWLHRLVWPRGGQAGRRCAVLGAQAPPSRLCQGLLRPGGSEPGAALRVGAPVQGAAAQRRRLRRERAKRARAGCRWSRAAWCSSASPASGSRATSSAAPTPRTTGALAPARWPMLCPAAPRVCLVALEEVRADRGRGVYQALQLNVWWRLELQGARLRLTRVTTGSTMTVRPWHASNLRRQSL